MIRCLGRFETDGRDFDKGLGKKACLSQTTENEPQVVSKYGEWRQG